jgi:hypothetical protein
VTFGSYLELYRYCLSDFGVIIDASRVHVVAFPVLVAFTNLFYILSDSILQNETRGLEQHIMFLYKIIVCPQVLILTSSSFFLKYVMYTLLLFWQVKSGTPPSGVLIN